MTKSGKERSENYLTVNYWLMPISVFFWWLLGCIHNYLWVGRPYENQAITQPSARLETIKVTSTDQQEVDSHSTQQRSQNKGVDVGDEPLSTDPNHQLDIDSESDKVESAGYSLFIAIWSVLSLLLGGVAVHLFLRQGFVSFKEAFLLAARTTSGTNLDEANCGDYEPVCYNFFLFLLSFSCFFPALQHFLYILSEGRTYFGQVLPVIFPFFKVKQKVSITKPNKKRIMEIKTTWKVADFCFIEPLKGRWLILWHVCLAILTWSLFSALWPLFIDQGIISIRFKSGACPADYQCFMSNFSNFSRYAPCLGAIRANCSSLTENTDELYCVKVHNATRWDFILALGSCYTVYAVSMKVVKAAFSILSSQCSARLDQYPKERPTAFYAVVLFVAMVVSYIVFGVSIVTDHLRKMVYGISMEILCSASYCIVLSFALPLIVYMLDFRVKDRDITPRRAGLPSGRDINSEKRSLLTQYLRSVG